MTAQIKSQSPVSGLSYPQCRPAPGSASLAAAVKEQHRGGLRLAHRVGAERESVTRKKYFLGSHRRTDRYFADLAPAVMRLPAETPVRGPCALSRRPADARPPRPSVSMWAIEAAIS